jgi:hypothetical protein
MQTTLALHTTSPRPDQPAYRLDIDIDLVIAGLGGMGHVKARLDDRPAIAMAA